MRFGGIVVATALVLAACSSDPAPKEPAGTTSSATPTVAVPTMPPQAAEDSPEGAAAFVKHYVDVFNYAAATGDVDELTRLSSPDCDGCQSYISEFEKIYDRGDSIAEVLWSLPADGEVTVAGNRVTALVAVNEGATRQYRFNFDLINSEGYSVEEITRKESNE